MSFLTEILIGLLYGIGVLLGVMVFILCILIFMFVFNLLRYFLSPAFREQVQKKYAEDLKRKERIKRFAAKLDENLEHKSKEAK